MFGQFLLTHTSRPPSNTPEANLSHWRPVSLHSPMSVNWSVFSSQNKLWLLFAELCCFHPLFSVNWMFYSAISMMQSVTCTVVNAEVFLKTYLTLQNSWLSYPVNTSCPINTLDSSSISLLKLQLKSYFHQLIYDQQHLCLFSLPPSLSIPLSASR